MRVLHFVVALALTAGLAGATTIKGSAGGISLGLADDLYVNVTGESALSGTYTVTGHDPIGSGYNLAAYRVVMGASAAASDKAISVEASNGDDRFAVRSDGRIEVQSGGSTAGFGINSGGTAATLDLNTASVLEYSLSTGNITANYPFSTTHYRTNTNCSDSAGAAACTAAPSGAVVIDAGATTVVVSTTVVTANSNIFVQEMPALATRLGITCNATTGRDYTVTALSAGTSFTITSSAAPATNPACLVYRVEN